MLLDVVEYVGIAVLALIGAFFLLWAAMMFLCPLYVSRFAILHIPGVSWQQGDISEQQWQKAHTAAPTLTALPKEGEVYISDYRKPNPNQSSDSSDLASLRVLTMNVFLGHNLEGLLQELGAVDPQPDVIFLQEDNIYEDIHTPGLFHHVGSAIASHLRMQCFFVPTKFRPQKRLREHATATTTTVLGGCYGLSILSNRPLTNITTLPCSFRPEIVERLRDILIGRRNFLYAQLQLANPSSTTPQNTHSNNNNNNNKTVGLVCVHFPSAGLFREKVHMFNVLLQQLAEKEISSPVIIAGDCNTFPRIASALPWASYDRIFCLQSESAAWRAVIGGQQHHKQQQQHHQQQQQHDNTSSNSTNGRYVQLQTPTTGGKGKYFMDPFRDDDCTAGIHSWLMRNKLDWVMVEKQKFVIEGKWKQVVIPNTPTRNMPSDHTWLMVQCRPTE